MSFIYLKGQFESNNVLRHTEEILQLVPNSSAAVIPEAGHTSNMGNSPEFNRLLEEYL
jgi:hypothetical protein